MSGPGEQKKEAIRMVLVGKAGVGKSASGNTILGRKAFQSTSSSSSLTSECQKETGEFEAQPLAVVDTPGLFDTRKSVAEKLKDVARCISLAAPGPHVFLVGIQSGRFTKEEQETVEIIQRIFGEKAAAYTMALITDGDVLKKKNVSVEDLMKQNPALNYLIDQCGKRYYVLNNKINDPSQVKELLEKINIMVQKNGGKYYTNDEFKEAENNINKMKQTEFLAMRPEDARKEAEKQNLWLQSADAAAAAVAEYEKTHKQINADTLGKVADEAATGAANRAGVDRKEAAAIGAAVQTVTRSVIASRYSNCHAL